MTRRTTETASAETPLETRFSRSYGKCVVDYEQNQSYARITQNGHCDYMNLTVACRDNKGTFSSTSTAAIGSNNPIYVDRTCFVRTGALSWWPSWNHVYSKYTSLIGVDFCVGANAAACTRWRWRDSGAY